VVVKVTVVVGDNKQTKQTNTLSSSFFLLLFFLLFFDDRLNEEEFLVSFCQLLKRQKFWEGKGVFLVGFLS
jgi:hypothetical protein